MKRIISLVLCGTLLASLAACSGGSSGGQTSTQQSEAAGKENETAAPAQTGSDKGTVKIGVLLPFTGASAYSAELAREGYDYAVEYYNGQGGIKSLGGAKLEIVYADTTGVTEVGVTEFERLVNVEKIDIAHEGSAGWKEISEKSAVPSDLPSAVSDILKRMEKGQSITRISRDLRLDPDFVETVCRIQVTHPGVTAAGIVDKMEVNKTTL